MGNLSLCLKAARLVDDQPLAIVQEAMRRDFSALNAQASTRFDRIDVECSDRTNEIGHDLSVKPKFIG
jgi:hypothetical protein